jgi:hypothetical protein
MTYQSDSFVVNSTISEWDNESESQNAEPEIKTNVSSLSWRNPQVYRSGCGLAHQESAGGVFGCVCNQTDAFLGSKPGPLADYPDPLLTLIIHTLWNVLKGMEEREKKRETRMVGKRMIRVLM